MPFTQTGVTPQAKVPRITPNTSGQVVKLNDGLTQLSVLSQLRIKSRTTATAPGSPVEGDAYIMPSGTLTGWHAGAVEHDISFYSNGWNGITPELGYVARLDTPELGVRLYYVPGSGWLKDSEWGSMEIGATASATQTQGQRLLTKTITVFSTVATTGDVCTLPAAPRLARVVFAINSGANNLQVFPSSGHTINALAQDASITVEPNKARLFLGTSASAWLSFVWSTV